MKRILPILFILFVTITSCDTRYSYATMTIKNKSTKSLAFKGLVRDEQSGDATGDWIIKVLPSNNGPISPNHSDTINHTWKAKYDSILFSVCWGFFKDTTRDYDVDEDNTIRYTDYEHWLTTRNYNVYDNTMDYVKIYDGQNVVFTIDGTSDPTITVNKL